MAEEEDNEKLREISIQEEKGGIIHCSYAKSWEEFKEHLNNFIKEHDTYSFDSIHTLNFDYNNIGAFPSEAFSDFSNLTSLKIEDCKTLSTEAFANLHKLKELTIENDISEIPQGFFNNLSSLEFVDFTRTKIKTIHTGTFKPLINLKRLIIRASEIKTLSPTTFKGLILLEELDISHNELVNLEENLFSDLKNLKMLNALSNSLGSSAFLAVRCLDSLEDLKMGCNKITDLDYLELNHLKNLRILLLNYIPITSLPENFAQKCGPIEILDFSNTNIIHIHPKAFEGLNTIKEIYFNDCKFANVLPELFQNVQVDHHFEISFEGNNLKYLTQASFKGYCKITMLYMETCKIRKIEAGTFKALPSLVELHLQNNCLQKLERGMFDGLTQLRKLGLDSNRISTIEDGCFKDLRSLNTLNLNGNILKSLKGKDFKQLSSLRWLSLQYNIIKRIESFEGLESLRFLDLSYNSLESDLENCFEGGIQLTYLYLMRCGLKMIGKLSSGVLNKLVNLDLGGNDINDLDLDFFKHISPYCNIKTSGNKIPIRRYVEIFKEYPHVTFIDESV